MIAIPTAEHEAFQGSSPKELTLEFPIGRTLTNENIFMESMTLEQSICDESNLVFGMVYSSCFSVRIFDDGLSYNGLKVFPHIAVDTYTRDLGEFVVKSDKLTSDKLYRDLKCYDKLSDVLPFDYAQWHNAMGSSFTLRQYRNAFFNYIGIEQEDITLPNDNVLLTKFSVDELSGSQILSTILQLNGCFGYIGYNGKFKYVLPKTTADYIISDNSFVQGSFEYEDEPMKKISGVTIKGYSDDYGDEATNTVDDVSSGDSTYSMLTVENNYLVQSCSKSVRQTLCTNLYNKLKNFTYYSSSVQFPAYIGLELGDVFQIATDRKTVTFPVLHRTLSGISALMDTLEAKGEGELSSNSNSVSGSVNSAQMAINQIRISVAEILAGKASVDDLYAVNGKIVNLETNYVTVNSTLIAHQADIETLNANKANITDLNASNARITTLEGGYAHISQLEANYGNIKTLLSGNAGVGDLQNIHLTSANTNIDEAVIKNLVSQFISVNDLLAGTISTNKFTIQSDDSAIKIDGSTQTFKDASGNVRIQMGQDAQGNFTFILYDATGQGVLLDSTGIKESAIADGLIKDAKVANDAAIKGSKLDIDSVVTELNKDGTPVLKSNKIWLDSANQTLTQAYQQTTNSVNGLNTRVGIVEAGINGLTVSLSDLQTEIEGVATDIGVIYQPVPTYTNVDTVTIDAKVYRGTTDIHEQFPPAWFSWHKKTESGITKIAEGYSVTLKRSDYEYSGTVVGRFTIFDSALLVLPDGNYIVFGDGSRLAVYYNSVGGGDETPLIKQIKAKDILHDGNVEVYTSSMIDCTPASPVVCSDDGYGNIQIGA